MASGSQFQELDLPSNMASTPQWRLELKDLPLLRRLGKGLSGYLNETKWRGSKYARKDFPLGSAERGSLFETEVKALFNLDHPNIVKCFGYTIGKSSCSLLQEYVDYNLQNTIQRTIEEKRRKASTGSSQPRVVAVDEIKGLLSASRVKRSESSGTNEASSIVPESRSKMLEPSSRMLDRRSAVPFEVLDAEDVVSQIANAMKYLHDNEVVHGDLKPKNVLWDLDQSGARKVKVADFGIIGTKKIIKLVSKRTRHLEILTWKAPELLEESLGPLTGDSDDPFTDSDSDLEEELGSSDTFLRSKLAMADVYSFGLTCSYVLGAKMMYPNMSLTQLRQQRAQGFEPKLPSTCPEYLKFIIHSCLGMEPLSRPTFSAICTARAFLPKLPYLMNMLEGKKLEGFMALTTLEINFQYNGRQLPSEIGNLIALETLELDCCHKLEELPSGIGNLMALKTLVMKSCISLHTLPNEIGNLIALETLELDHCDKLEELPSGIGNLMALKTLVMKLCTSLYTLPNEIGNLIALETLELDRCYELRKLPSGIGNLMALKTLVMKSCISLYTLPNEIGNLIALETLELDHCDKLEELPSGIGNLMALKTLVMKLCTSLYTLPNEIGNLIALETLELDRCYKLRKLPSGIGNLMALKTLVMKSCISLYTLPNEIGNLIALETLELDRCYKLEELPSGIGNLMALKTLVMKLCKNLHTLPNKIGNLIALETLELDSCYELKELPSGIGKLIALKNMVIRNCSSLRTLPDEIETLTALKILDCPSLEHSGILQGVDVGNSPNAWVWRALEDFKGVDVHLPEPLGFGTLEDLKGKQQQHVRHTLEDRKQKRKWHFDTLDDGIKQRQQRHSDDSDSDEAALVGDLEGLETWTGEASRENLTSWAEATPRSRSEKEKGEKDHQLIENWGGQGSQVASLQEELAMVQAQRLLDLQQTHHQQQHQHQQGIVAQAGQAPDELMRLLADQSQMSTTGLSIGLPLPPYSHPVKPEEGSYDLHSMEQKQQHHQHQDGYYDLGMPSSSLQDVQSEQSLLESLHKSRSGGGIGDQPDEGEI